jgi:flagellar capping protein FliD
LFERATVNEILDIRRELEKPLWNFRSAMVKFSQQIQSASWDKDFTYDADRVFRSEVTPAVLALEDEKKSSSFLNKLTAKVAEKSIQVGSAVTASAAVTALAVRMLNLPLADVAALAAGPAIVAGGVAYSAYKEWKEQQQKTEGNSLFFYYKAGSLLESRSFEYDDRKRSCNQSSARTA